MGKKTFVAAGLAAMLLTACSEERTLPVGEGTVHIAAVVNSDVKVESRAAADDDTDNLAASTIIWISNDEGVVRRYNSLNELPLEGVKLISGNYTVKAWAGKSEYASFTSRWFEGSQNFTLAAGDNKTVVVTCRIANVVASVAYADDIDNSLTDYNVTVSHKSGSLTFEGRDDRKGYFMMPEGDSDLEYTLTATAPDGHDVKVSGTIRNVEPAHEYVLNVKVVEGEADASLGAGFIGIEIDDTMIEVADNVTISVPPMIVGDEFDITSPVAGAGGSVSAKNVYVSAGAPLTSVKISGVPGLAEFDLLTASQSQLATIRQKGIDKEVTNVGQGQLMKIVFAESLLSGLAVRTEPYEFVITAADEGGKSSTAVFAVLISESPLVTTAPAAADLGYSTAVLRAQVMKDIDAAGFEYRKKGDSEWTYVAATSSRAAFAKGQYCYASLSRLAVGQAYECRAVSGDFIANVIEFKTNAGPQLVNAGMEDWYTSGKVVIPQANGGTEFWDSGNHGSSTMSVTLTNQSADKVHGGKSGAKLRSQFVGIGGSIGKFAAGNIFVGKYLATEGTDGLLGFGRPFEIPQGIKVTKLRVWAHYTPGTVQKNGAKDAYLQQGATDRGDIYIALFDDFDNYLSDYANQYGCIVRTKNAEKLFNRDAANVVAYGDRPLNEATVGSDLALIEIPLEYNSGRGWPKILAVVCSASLYGDYFCGGEGSTLYVDDFELVYEPI